MEFRKLGRTGFDVGTIGFGLWQLGGGRWSAPARSESIRLLRAARDLGVNLFDAAVVYGQYRDGAGALQCRSQELLAEAFASRRREVLYCVKVGQFDEVSHRADYAPRRLVQHITESLERLKTDYLDICLVHAPSLHEVRTGCAIAVLQALQEIGMIRNIGYSFENEPEHVQLALTQPIDVVMLQYNLLDRECEQAIAEAHERGVGILAGGPLKRGYLSGAFRSSADLPRDDDYWRWNLEKCPLKVEHILSKAAELEREHGGPAGLRRAAFEQILGQAGVACAVVGHRSIAEITENIENSRSWTVHTGRNPAQAPRSRTEGLSFLRKEAA